MSDQTGREILNALQPHLMSDQTGHDILNALLSQAGLTTASQLNLKKVAPGKECPVFASGVNMFLRILPGIQLASARLERATCH